MLRSHDIARAVAESARETDPPATLAETLSAIVEVARETIAGIDQAGVSVALSDGRMITRAATDQLVHRLDQLQYQTRVGPCVHAMRDEGMVLLENIDREQRWPAFTPRARQLGLRSLLTIRLFSDTTSLGTLNLYCTRADRLSRQARATADVFALQAAAAFNRAKSMDQLTGSVPTQHVIGQATGIVMERCNVTSDRAFGTLVQTSRALGLALVTVAQGVIESHAASHPADLGAGPPWHPTRS